MRVVISNRDDGVSADTLLVLGGERNVAGAAGRSDRLEEIEPESCGQPGRQMGFDALEHILRSGPLRVVSIILQRPIVRREGVHERRRLQRQRLRTGRPEQLRRRAEQDQRLHRRPQIGTGVLARTQHVAGGLVDEHPRRRDRNRFRPDLEILDQSANRICGAGIGLPLIEHCGEVLLQVHGRRHGQRDRPLAEHLSQMRLDRGRSRAQVEFRWRIRNPPCACRDNHGSPPPWWNRIARDPKEIQS